MWKYFLFLCTSPSLFALTTLNVTLSSDNNPGGFGDPGDLRYCINTMNENLNGLPDDHAIVFAFPMTIQLNGLLPLINNSANSVNITIGNSNPAAPITLDGNSGAYSGFFIPMGNVTLQNLIFQNMTAKGGNGGDGISGGGGGMGAGGAIYVPQTFLNGSYPTVTLINVTVNNCSTVGGNGGNGLSVDFTGNEGGGGGGGLAGNGGSIAVFGSTGGGGGGGFGGDGGSVYTSSDGLSGGGGGGGGGIGSRATLSPLTNLGNGGSDQSAGTDGNAYGLSILAGSGAGNYTGGTLAGGGGGGNAASEADSSGGGGGGSLGDDGKQPQGGIPPGGSTTPSGGFGGDGGGGGGGGIVLTSIWNNVDGQAGSGGYAGGGGGGSGVGASDVGYTVKGGAGGVGGGGGGGGVNLSGTTPSQGGDSLGGGGGGGGGPSSEFSANGGEDLGNLGGGRGGMGASNFGASFGGGGGGGGSALGPAIFVDSSLNLTIQALSGVPTVFNTSNLVAQAGTHGTGGPEGTDGFDGSALAESIFLRSGSSLTLSAADSSDLLTLGEGVSFTDDTAFGGGGTRVWVTGNGTVIYNGSTDYPGSITIFNANFKVNGTLNQAPIAVCRNLGIGTQRGTLSGKGTLSGNVFVNSGTIAPDAGEILTLGSLILSPAYPESNTLGSLVHIEIDPSTVASQVVVNGSATLAGTLEIDLDPNAATGVYILLTSSGLNGTFDAVTFTGPTPNYTLSYLPSGSPTFVQFELLPPPHLQVDPPSRFQGIQKKNDFGFVYEIYNQLSWKASPSAETVGYYLYRDAVRIAQLSASTLSYQDHNREKGVSYLYTITAFNAEGVESQPVSIEIKEPS